MISGDNTASGRSCGKERRADRSAWRPDAGAEGRDHQGALPGTQGRDGGRRCQRRSRDGKRHCGHRDGCRRLGHRSRNGRRRLDGGRPGATTLCAGLVAQHKPRTIKQNRYVSPGVVAVLIPAAILGLNIGTAVLFHEESTLIVVVNALRLLAYRRATSPPFAGPRGSHSTLTKRSSTISSKP